MKLISACLLGIKCNWSGGKHYRNERALELSRVEAMLPVCPEQLGGLAIPRPPQEIQGGTGDDVLEGRCLVLDQNGVDVTGQFIRGAEETLKIAKQFNIHEFIGKSSSPSCSCNYVYNGSFSGRAVEGNGVTAALLKRNGIRIIAEEEL